MVESKSVANIRAANTPIQAKNETKVRNSAQKKHVNAVKQNKKDISKLNFMRNR